MSSIIYTLGNNLYINLTNRCPCDCVFCLRYHGDSVGSADSLWLDEEPTAKQVMAALTAYNLSNYAEVVFCGYGEPFCALETLLDVCREIRAISDIIIRIDTNGLGDLIHGKPTAALLKGLVDALSISLNAPDAGTYDRLCRPEFGPASFDAMLRFARDSVQSVPKVVFTVVERVAGPDETEACRKIAADLGIPLRVRTFV